MNLHFWVARAGTVCCRRTDDKFARGDYTVPTDARKREIIDSYICNLINEW